MRTVLNILNFVLGGFATTLGWLLATLVSIMLIFTLPLTRSKIDHIFDKGVSTKGSERGVGLALVKQQVENLGGSIAVESEPGIFTQFFVQIPWDGERSNR